MTAKHAKPAPKKRIKINKKHFWLNLVLCIALIVSTSVTTLSSGAWLYHAPDAKVVKLKGSNLSISIVDVKGQQLIPGKTYTLSATPTVTIAANSVECWAFVRIVEQVDQFDTFSMHANWKQYGSTAYYYQKVASSTSATTLQILANNTIKAKDSLEHSNGTLTGSTVTFRSCAVQAVGGIDIDTAKNLADNVI